MNYQVWYGVLFSGEDADKPSLPQSGHMAVRTMSAADLPAGLAWVNCGKHYGLTVVESVQAIREPAGELTNYPADIADVWAAKLAGALGVLGIGTAKITWYVSAAA